MGATDGVDVPDVLMAGLGLWLEPGSIVPAALLTLPWGPAGLAGTLEPWLPPDVQANATNATRSRAKSLPVNILHTRFQVHAN